MVNYKEVMINLKLYSGKNTSSCWRSKIFLFRRINNLSCNIIVSFNQVIFFNPTEKYEWKFLIPVKIDGYELYDYGRILISELKHIKLESFIT